MLFVLKVITATHFMNKIQHGRQFIVAGVVFFLSTCHCVYGQDTLLNKYGLWVIADTAVYSRTVRHNPAKEMTDLRKAVPGIQMDLRYSTRNNFMHQPLYPPLRTTWLRRPAALALAAVQTALKKQGLGLKIFDAYRPYSATEKMWEPVQDDRYAADPRKGSGHNRGTAVDLTIVQLKTGKVLDMGTTFDNFSDTAHHAFSNLPEKVLQNRLLLKTLMEQNGFKALDTEWWHYSLPDARAYELLNLSFAQLTALSKRKKRI